MKAVRFIIPKTSEATFRLQEDKAPFFYDSIHYHPEYQLTLILKGEGTRFIGNSVERYKPGDLFFIGKNVPHVFRSDQEYYKNTSSLESHSVSIFINDEILGEQFLNLPELTSITRLLELSLFGVSYKQEEKKKTKALILASFKLKSFERFLHILDLLQRLSKIEDFQLLSPTPFIHPSKESDNERINTIFQYLSSHFTSDITLQDIASIANMTTNSFCRYFKKRTGKPFSHFLNTMRIEYACHLMVSTNDGIGSISMDCGYNNISYFNRQFKKFKKLRPNEYRQKYSMNLSKDIFT